MRILIILCLFFPAMIRAQSTVAVADFRNQTSEFHLDNWERLIPQLLTNELSASKNMILVERNRLESVLREQALSMTGLIDSSTAQAVGGLLGAQYIISGVIDKSDGDILINCRILRVATGELKTEFVRAPDSDHLEEMIRILGNNILHILAADRDYIEKYELKKYPASYFLGASAVLATGTLLAHLAYQDKSDKYQNTTRLSEFDNAYDQANTYYKTRNIFAALTGVALAGTVYCWVQNMNPAVIEARDNSRSISLVPILFYSQNGDWSANVVVWF